jgi:hypothetical protein
MNDDWYVKTDTAISELKAGHVNLLSKLEENTASTLRVEENTKGVVNAFEAASGAFKVLETVGKVAKPLLWIGGVGSGFALSYAHLKQWIITFLSK